MRNGKRVIRMGDLAVDKCAAILEYLDPMPETTKRLDRWGTKHYKSQKAHMILWFLSQEGTGGKGYTRKQGNTSSMEAYNRLLNAGALIWIADALGEDPEVIQRATAAAIEAEKINYRGRCSAFREVIPWARIDELIHDPSGWKIDPAVKDFLSWWKGWPAPDPDKEEEYMKVIQKELGL